MRDKIKEIISENSEEKHFVGYGKGVFATDDAVDVMVEEIVKLFDIPVVIKSACSDYVDGINMDCATCGRPKYKHRQHSL